MIRVRDLRKDYKVHSRPPGLLSAARSLVHRTYTTVHAVAGVSFEIEAGEKVGFLGPNGAGKTTTLKVLAGLLHPTSGEALVGGHVPRCREVEFLKQITLVMGQKQQLLWDLPPAETFELNRAVYGVAASEFASTMQEITELLEISDLVKRPTRQLSLGERMKCELAAALVHRPRVLFLDEPTIGLDVTMQATIRSFIRRYNERFNATLMLTSHYMDDVAAICDRIIVIDRGTLTYDGSLPALVDRISPEKRIVVRLSEPTDTAGLRLPGRLVSSDSVQVVLQVPKQSLHTAVSMVLSSLPVQDLTVEDPPLEEVLGELFARTRAAREDGR